MPRELTNCPQSSTVCLHCGLCCYAFHNLGFVTNREEWRVVQRFGGTLTTNQEEELCFVQPCPAFFGRCSVYPDRPASCKGYECNLLDLIKNNAIDVERAKKIIENMKAEIASIDSKLEKILGTRSIIVDDYIALFFEQTNKKTFLIKTYQDLLLHFGMYTYLREKYFDNPPRKAKDVK